MLSEVILGVEVTAFGSLVGCQEYISFHVFSVFHDTFMITLREN
jgi:hypothetical protein